MKYRILKSKYGNFIPQKKFLFFWTPFVKRITHEDYFNAVHEFYIFDTLEEAIKFLYTETFSDEVVWESK